MAVLETEKYNFRYVRTAAGTLPGRDFILQTEAAITELGNTALDNTEEALENSRQALTNSENALNIANSAQSDASLALTVAYDARERAVNAADAASQAQKTADQAVSDAAAAQTAADKAQSTADYAQELAESGLELAREANTKAENAQTTADTALETANTALENANDAANAATAAQNTADDALAKAEAAQETADSAQETADSAQSLADTNSDLISSLGTELTNVQSSLEEQINAMGFWFELDESTTSLELWGTVLAKKYLTQSISDGPAGTSPPYWFWNFVREDGKGCVQWLRTSDGTIYSREGTNTSYQINDASDSFDLVAFSDAEATVSLAGSSADNTLTWTVSGGGSIEAQSQGMLTTSCTIVMQLSSIPEEGDITLNGVIIGTLTNEGVVQDMTLTADHCNVSLDSAEIDEAASTVTITLLANWTDYVSGDTTWGEWATLSGGESSGLPTGSVIPYMGDDIPSGYLLCNGAEVEIAEYPNLYAKLLDSCGTPVDPDCFVLPDCRDRFLMGSGTNSPGVEIDAGLPDVTGRVTVRQGADKETQSYVSYTVDTAYYGFEIEHGEGAQWGRVLDCTTLTYDTDLMWFKASNSNALYSASTIQPPAMAIRFLVRI